MEDGRVNNKRPRKQLRFTDQEIWEMYWCSNGTYRDIAMICGVSKNTIKRIIDRTPPYFHEYLAGAPRTMRDYQGSEKKWQRQKY